ncbi:MAG: ABC transporter ATP-binding protein [Theionarchaea archaeon]|nr:ABC transporter ATP-binding protein [Theionarchaea archaeon]
MSNLVKPPKSVRVKLGAIMDSSENVKASAMADIDRDGKYGESWVFMTKKRLIVLEKDGEISFELPVSKIESLEVREFSGSGILIAENDKGQCLDVVRFSKTQSRDFLLVAKQAIDILRANGNGNGKNGNGKNGNGVHLNGEEVGGALEDNIRCPKCGRALPAVSTVCPHCIQKGKVLRRLLGYMKPHWKVAALSLSMTVAVTLLAFVPPLLLRTLINGISAIYYGESTSTAFLYNIAISLIGVYASMQIIGAIRTYTEGWLGEHIIFDIRTRVYRYLQMLSLSFYDRRRTGELMSRVTNDSANVRAFLVSGLQTLIVNFVTMIGVIVILFSTNWQLAALSLFPVPILLLGTTVFARKIHGIYHRIWRSWARMSSVLADTLPGILVVKAFAQETREVDKFEDSTRIHMDAVLRSTRLRSMFFPGIAFMMYLGSVVVYWQGGFLVSSKALTPGDLVLFVSLLWMFYGPVQTLSSITDQFEVAMTAAERIFEVLDSRPDVADNKDAVDLKEIKGHILLKDVTFSYTPEKKVISNVSLEIKPGEMIGLAGPSGSGKTTLVKLVSRFYDPEDGYIEIDGVNLKKIRQRQLRERIGVVLQEPFLFHGSIAENIAYGRPHATRMEIIAAARAANAHEFILRLPNGYDTEVGEKGARLSGGEKQRISIARAIINKPSIIILDEATSSVDSVTEKQIQEALERLVAGKTTIAIAHRLSTLRNADKLVILDEGRIVEEGSHSELLEMDGVYANLVKMQTEIAKVRAV